ncbi:MAG: CoA ester lyase [Burkholderiales bacterium]
MHLWRSLLFVPANQRRMLDKLHSLPADGFIFDLEDTVPAPEKANARAMTAEAIAKLPEDRSWIRCNALDSGFIHEDFDAFVGMPKMRGFVVPKQDSVGDIAAVDRMLTSLEVRRGLSPGSTPVIAMIESAAGVLSARDIFSNCKRIESGMYAGGEDGDMNVSLGAVWSSEGPEMMFVRQMTFVAARAANIKFPLEAVFSNIKDHEGFRRDTMLSRRLGYRGRAVIHPTQIEIANDIYTPTAAEVDYATRVLAAYQEALTRGVGSTTVDGKLVDIAMAKTAQNLLDLVAAISGQTS